MKLLAQKQEVQTDELVTYFGSSESTIRRDLVALQNDGLLIRTFGGAKLPVEKSLVAKTFEEKKGLMSKEKDLIGRKAAEFIKPGTALMLDGGTTLWSAFEIIKHKQFSALKQLDVLKRQEIARLGVKAFQIITCAGGGR